MLLTKALASNAPEINLIDISSSQSYVPCGYSYSFVRVANSVPSLVRTTSYWYPLDIRASVAVRNCFPMAIPEGPKPPSRNTAVRDSFHCDQKNLWIHLCQPTGLFWEQGNKTKTVFRVSINVNFVQCALVLCHPCRVHIQKLVKIEPLQVGHTRN